MGPADLRGDRLQRHRLRAPRKQQAARGFDRGRAAFFRAQVVCALLTSVSVSLSSPMMNAITLPTPADLTITPRDRRFGREAATPRLWHGGRVEATAIYNALSTTFPKGEAFFVESVRAFRDGAPPKLAEEIKGFTTQEAIHSREHDAFNKRAADAGYDLRKLEAQVEKRLAVTSDQAADRQPRRDHGARAFHRDPRASVARRPAASRGRRPRNGRAVALARGRGDRAQGRRLRHLAVRDAATGRGGSAGRSRPR